MGFEDELKTIMLQCKMREKYSDISERDRVYAAAAILGVHPLDYVASGDADEYLAVRRERENESRLNRLESQAHGRANA